MLQKLQENYKAVKEQISKENTRISKMKMDIPEMQKAIAAQSEAVDRERDKLLGDIIAVEEQMEALEKLAKDHPENKKVIKQEMVQLKVQLEDMMASYEVTKIRYDVTKHNADKLRDEIKEREVNVKTFTEEAGKIMSDIKTIRGLIREQAKVDYMTPKFKK